MSNFIPPEGQVVEDDGGFCRTVELPNGAQAHQYYDVENEQWLYETNEIGNFVTVDEEGEENDE